MATDVLLRDVTEGDLPIFFEQQRDPAANHMAAFTAEDPADRAAFMAKWAKILADDSITKRTILFGGQVAGSVSTFVAPWSGKLEVTYWIGREFWGKGIATKALAALLSAVKTRPLYARAAKDNVASLRVLEKCGFMIVGSERGFANARGEEVEEVVLELKAEALVTQGMSLQPGVFPVAPDDVPRLVEVWEAAVRATHHFLSEADIQFFKPFVRDGLLGVIELACVRDQSGDLAGFVGVDGPKVEALFVHPTWHGVGAGRRLLQYAVGQLGARTVDVNEQNPQAVGFYLRMGFEIEGRSEKDSLGKPFPLLHLSLRSPSGDGDMEAQ